MRNALIQASLFAAGGFLLFSGHQSDETSRRLDLDGKDGAANTTTSAISTNSDLASQGFDTAGRLVLSTMPRGITDQHPHRVKYGKYHLQCIAEVAKVSDVHIVVYASDEELAKYIEEESGDEGELPARLEVSRIPPEEDKEYSELLRRLPTLHPDASGYGWMNGDICPTPAFIEAANTFIAADCPEGKGLGVESQWRFISGNRYNVEANMDDIDLSGQSAFEIAYTSEREEYTAGGADIFVWNRAFYMDHLLPMIPDFSLPLWAVDNFFLQDAHCNSLVLMAEFGWSPDAIPLHLAHYFRNGVRTRETAKFKSDVQWGSQSRQLNNWEQRDKVNKSTWKRKGCQSQPIAAANDCKYDFATKSFDLPETCWKVHGLKKITLNSIAVEVFP